jgi:hypothetical protein
VDLNTQNIRKTPTANIFTFATEATFKAFSTMLQINIHPMKLLFTSFSRATTSLGGILVLEKS